MECVRPCSVSTTTITDDDDTIIIIIIIMHNFHSCWVEQMRTHQEVRCTLGTFIQTECDDATFTENVVLKRNNKMLHFSP